MKCALYGYEREILCERHVQAVWYDKAIRPDDLYTRDGEELRVIHPGEWNLGPGPDFKNAVLEVGPGRRKIKGDVEIHLSPQEWDAHGHGGDPAYSRVVAHVTWKGGPDPVTLPKGAVTVWIGRYMMSEPGFSPESIDLAAYPFSRLPIDERPCWENLHEDRELAEAILSAAGRHRLSAKARRIDVLLSRRKHERLQVFYEEVMCALGYRWNTAAFGRMAAVVPYSQIVAEPDLACETMLAASQFMEWRRHPSRPGNAPERRLAAAVKLFSEGGIASLADAGDFSREGCAQMVRTMSGGRLVGRGRAGAIIANVVAPWAIAERKLREAPDWLPPEDVSEPVRLTAYRMFGRDHHPPVWYSGNGLHIQGLLQIYRDYCLRLHPDCTDCAVGAVKAS